MDRLTQRLEVAAAALGSLEAIVAGASNSDLERDAAILRFQYSFESVWKAAQHRLRDREGIDAGSPKQVIRACLEAGLLDADQTHRALAIADDRNLTVHTYNEPLALALVGRLPEHAVLLRQWLESLRG
jgi:nucleotidyltransferase substrate binding protein (TIGR01987 family)